MLWSCTGLRGTHGFVRSETATGFLAEQTWKLWNDLSYKQYTKWKQWVRWSVQGPTTYPGSSPICTTGKYKKILLEAGLGLRARILKLSRIKISKPQTQLIIQCLCKRRSDCLRQAFQHFFSNFSIVLKVWVPSAEVTKAFEGPPLMESHWLRPNSQTSKISLEEFAEWLRSSPCGCPASHTSGMAHFQAGLNSSPIKIELVDKVKIWPDQIYDVQNYKSLMVYWDLAHNHTHHSGFWKHHFFFTLDNGVKTPAGQSSHLICNEMSHTSCPTSPNSGAI